MHRNIIRSKAEYTRLYEGIDGICADKGIIDPTKKLLYAENMYVDPEGGGGAIESVPGFRILHNFDAPIRAIHTQKLSTGEEYLLIHAGDKLYRISMTDYEGIADHTPVSVIADCKSHSYCYEGNVYILDGISIIRIDENGKASKYSSGDIGDCYVPLTYRDGRAVEDRNLLSEKFRESMLIGNADDSSYGTPGLLFSVTDPIAKSCMVSGVLADISGPVYVPSHTIIEGVRYSVTAIGEGAFRDNANITEIYLSRGIRSIEKWAFWGMKNLTRIVFSHTVETVGERAFYFCQSLTELYLGIGISSFGNAAFAGCSSLSIVSYAGDEVLFLEIETRDVLGYFNSRFPKLL